MLFFRFSKLNFNIMKDLAFLTKNTLNRQHHKGLLVTDRN